MHFIPTDHDDENEKDRLAARLANPTMTDRAKKLFSGLSTTKKQNIGGHEQDNHDEVSTSLFHFYIASFL